MAVHFAKKPYKKAHEKGCVTKCRGGREAYSKSGHKHAYRSEAHTWAKANAAAIYNVDFTLLPNRKRLDAIFGNSVSEKAHGKGVRRKLSDPRESSRVWRLDHSINFQKGYRPYNHDSHHMVPCEGLAEAFEAEELLLLMEAEYNINRGENMIILPKKEKVGQALRLPVHYSNHTQYTEFVRAQLQSIKFVVGKEKQNHEITDDNKQKVREEIETLEPELREVLLALGQAHAIADLENFDQLMMSL
jgi:hypothetical protein